MGKKTSTSKQTVSIPPEVLARYNAVNARAEQAASTPFKYYGGEFVAPLTSTQRAGMANINNAATMAQPYYASATNYLQNAQAATQPYFGAAGDAYGAGLAQGQGYLGAATEAAGQGGRSIYASDLNSDAINKYMSPYLQNVLQGTAGLLNQQNQQAMSGQTGNAIRQGAFGGDRGGIAAANLAQQQRLADASIFSNILNQGYNNALNTAIGQQQINLSAEQANRAAQQGLAERLAALGQQGFNQYTATGQNVQGLGKDIYGVGAQTSQAMANLGTGAQNAAIQGGQAQMEAGGIEQATQQALDTAKYNEFKEAQSYPFQTAQFLANIAEGTGALSGSTTTTAQPGGFFSDERMKENIQPVGKTYDGQHIYRYNYKGDDTTHIGLIAQEVERHHPEAVGLAGGMKTVNYDKATDHAAHMAEPHKGLGGFLSKNGPGIALFAASPFLWSQLRPDQNKDDGESMGGGVMPQQAGQGFASGGLADHAARMAKLYEQLYSAGSGHGVAGMEGIPTKPIDIPELMVARGFDKNGNPVEDAVNAIDAIGKFGTKVGAWRYGQQQKREKDADGGMVVDPIEQKRQEEAAGLAKAALEASKPTPPAGLGAAAPDHTPVQSTPINLENNKIKAPTDEMKFGKPISAPHLSIANAPTKPTNHGSATIDDLSKLVQMGTSMFGAAGGAAHGGRIHRDLGGAMPYSGGQSIVPDSTPQQHQLMTAQGTAGGGGGGLGAIGAIGGLASKLIPGGGIVKKGLGMIGKIFSDERMKENIRPIGELFDGQKVYSYNLKGDHRTQIGLLAQEVEHHRPHAVGLAGGMKTVDYHDATQHAAHRGHFADGGMPDDYQISSPGLTEIMHSLHPLGIKTASFPERLALNRQHDFWKKSHEDENTENIGEALGAAAAPPPAENMMPTRRSLADAARNPRQTLERPQAGLNAPVDTKSLPTSLAGIASLIFQAEGNGTVSTSTARGRYGLTRDTYHGYFAKAYPEKAKQLGYAGIERLRTSPEGEKLNEQFGPMVIADNAKILQSRGYEPNATNVYLAHFLGGGGATRMLKALEHDPNTPVEAAINKESIDSNPLIFGGKRNIRTVGQLYNFIGGRMAEMDKYLRQKHASGGLAGRHGYADGSAVIDTSDPLYQDPSGSEAILNQKAFNRHQKDRARYTGANSKDFRNNLDFWNERNAEEKGYSQIDDFATPEYQALIKALDKEEADRAANAKVVGDTPTTGVSPLPSLPPASNYGIVENADGSVGKASYTSQMPTHADQSKPKRAGLIQRMFGYDPEHPFNDKINPDTGQPVDQNYLHRLGHGKPDAVISLLQGLAAMGTTPTRSLGVALAAGLGAGATGYQQQRDFNLQNFRAGSERMSSQASVRESLTNQIRANTDAYDKATGRLDKLNALLAKVRSDKAYAASQMDDLSKPENQKLLNQLEAQERMVQNAINAIVGGRAGPQGIPSEQLGAPITGPSSTGGLNPNAKPANPPSGGLQPQSAAAPEGSAYNLPVSTFDPSRPETWVKHSAAMQYLGGPTAGVTQANSMLDKGLVVDKTTGEYSPYQPIIEAAKEREGQIATRTKSIEMNSNYVQTIAQQQAFYQNNKAVIDALTNQLSGYQQLGQSVPPDFWTKLSNAWAKVAGLPEDQVSKSTAEANIINAARVLLPEAISENLGNDINAINLALTRFFSEKGYNKLRQAGVQAALDINAPKGKGHEYDNIVVGGRSYTFEEFANQFAQIQMGQK